MKKQSAVHLHLGHWLLVPAVNCSHTASVPLNHIQYFQCSEQQVIWNGRPEEEGTEGCFRSVHAKGNCASIQFTNNTVNRIWYIHHVYTQIKMRREKWKVSSNEMWQTNIKTSKHVSPMTASIRSHSSLKYLSRLTYSTQASAHLLEYYQAKSCQKHWLGVLLRWYPCPKTVLNLQCCCLYSDITEIRGGICAAA